MRLLDAGELCIARPQERAQLSTEPRGTGELVFVIQGRKNTLQGSGDNRGHIFMGQR
jgi:hypothetical protein